MLSDSLSASIDKRRHPVLVSYFASTDGAQLAVADLMSEGLSEQDFTLLRLSKDGESGGTDPLEYVVAPFAGNQSNLSDITEGTPDRESEIGGGISTSSPDDDVSGPEEMDDSESASEDLIYPAEDRSRESDEAQDVEVEVTTGFSGTAIPPRSYERAAEPVVDEIDLPGIGTLVGEGSFGTTVLDKVFKDGDMSLAWLAARFNERVGESGVSVGKTGAVLAIDVNATGPNPARIEEVLLREGAGWVRSL